MWNCVMLSCLVSHHICEIVSCYPVWLDNINMNYFMPSFIPHYPLHLSIIQCLYIQLLFLFISHLNWRGWWQYLREQKPVLHKRQCYPLMQIEPWLYWPHKLAPAHIIETLTDCTLTPLGREPATTHLTATPADSNPLLVDIAPCPPQSTPTRAVCKPTAVPKARRPP